MLVQFTSVTGRCGPSPQLVSKMSRLCSWLLLADCSFRRPRYDAELFALVAEYRRLWSRANEKGIDDDERAHRCDEADAILDRLDEVRPAPSLVCWPSSISAPI